MQKVDLVIAGVGVVAVLATVLGIVFYDEAAATQTFEFEEVELAGAFGSKTASGTTASFDWPVPDNATSASFEVQVTATGTSIQGGSVTFTVTIETPDGATHTETGSITIPQASATQGSWPQSVSIAHRWAEVPEAVKGDLPDNATTVWTQPVRITVSISGPGNTLGDSLTYVTAASGDATAYQLAPARIPDPSGAQ